MIHSEIRHLQRLIMTPCRSKCASRIFQILAKYLLPRPETHGRHAYDFSDRHVAVEPVHAVEPAVSMPVAYPLPPLNEVTHG